jgi:hypothetical protein
VGEHSEQRSGRWIAFVAGAVAALALGLAYLAWSRVQDAAGDLKLSVRPAAVFPQPPRLPDAPELPDAPVPKPQ